MLGITGYKVALCFAYLRFTHRAMPRFRMITWAVMAFIVVANLTSTLVLIFQCNPIAKSWKPELPGWCLANYPTWNATAAITIFCDVVTFLLPVPLFARLQIDRRRKLGLIFLFVLGLFTTICSVMRMVQIKQIAKDGNNSTLVLWGTAELNVGVRPLHPVPPLAFCTQSQNLALTNLFHTDISHLYRCPHTSIALPKPREQIRSGLLTKRVQIQRCAYTLAKAVPHLCRSRVCFYAQESSPRGRKWQPRLGGRHPASR